MNETVRKFDRVRRFAVFVDAVITKAEDVGGPVFRDHPAGFAAVDTEDFFHPAKQDGLLFVAGAQRAGVGFVFGDRGPGRM